MYPLKHSLRRIFPYFFVLAFSFISPLISHAQALFTFECNQASNSLIVTASGTIPEGAQHVVGYSYFIELSGVNPFHDLSMVHPPHVRTGNFQFVALDGQIIELGNLVPTGFQSNNGFLRIPASDYMSIGGTFSGSMEFVFTDPIILSDFYQNGVTGNVYWGTGNVLEEHIIGEVSFHSCEPEPEPECEFTLTRHDDFTATLSLEAPFEINSNSPNVRPWLLGLRDAIEGVPTGIVFMDNSLKANNEIDLWNGGHSNLEMPNAMLKLAFYDKLPDNPVLEGDVRIILSGATWKEAGTNDSVWWGLDNNSEWTTEIGCYEIINP